MKSIGLSLLALLFLNFAYSQDAKKAKTAVIKTSAECGQCKERIEGVMNYTKGVKFATLNVETKELTVKYLPLRISLEEIKKIISESGYDADDIKADPKAQGKLPACCRPGGMHK